MFNTDFIQVQKDQLDLQDSGFLSVLATLSRTGVFVYSRALPDGTIETFKQLRLPEEVEASLETLVGVPVTNNHPEEMVSVENAGKYVVGMTSDRPKMIKMDGDESHDYIQQEITIFDESTIDDIRDGSKRELSLGYHLDLDETPGEWNGQAYDAIQRNIRYNHVSLVKKGRAGELCRVQLDDKEINLDGVSSNKVLYFNNAKGEEMVFNHDGKEYKVEDDATHALLTTLSTKVASLDALQAELDSVTAKLDATTDAGLKEAKEAKDAADFKAAVKARVALETGASRVLGTEVALDDLSDREIKEKVIATVSDIALDAKSDAYVDARYDIALETKAENVDSTATLGAAAMTNTDTKECLVTAARKRAWDRMTKGEA